MNRALKLISLLVLIIIVSLVPELIGGDLSEVLQEKLGKYYYAIISGIGLLALLLYTLWSDGDKLLKKEQKQTTLEQIRDDLLDKYKKRRDSKLAAKLPINLELKYTTEGSKDKRALNWNIQQKDIKETIVEVFDKHHGRLLIIGTPGAGKTTLLLKLAVELLQREKAKIPLIVNIATWHPRFSSVEDWLRELLPQTGSFPKALTQRLLQENRFLLLFDGLDELAAENRQSYLEAIEQFGIVPNRRFVICSRIAEYVETIDAPVYCQVRVKLLDIEQIKQGLLSPRRSESSGILGAVEQDVLLAKTIQTPFYFNAIQLLFASRKSWEEFGFTAHNLGGRKAEIVSTFVEETIHKFKDYTSKDSKKWLGFLAHRMNEHGLVDFELLSLQYDWTSLSKVQNIGVKYFSGLVKGMLYSVASISIAFAIVFIRYDFIVSLFVSVMISIPYGFGIGLIKSFTIEKVTIISKDYISWSFFTFWNCIKYNFGLLLIVCLFGSSLHGLLYGIYYSGIFLLLISIKTQFDNNKSYIKITYPYQRFYASIRALHFSIVQHWHLRRILHRQGLLPKDLVDFLNEATEHHILESDGGTWRFRHRILQDYFAKHYERL